jgi:hypothetical protein
MLLSYHIKWQPRCPVPSKVYVGVMLGSSDSEAVKIKMKGPNQLQQSLEFFDGHAYRPWPTSVVAWIEH